MSNVHAQEAGPDDTVSQQLLLPTQFRRVVMVKMSHPFPETLPLTLLWRMAAAAQAPAMTVMQRSSILEEQLEASQRECGVSSKLESTADEDQRHQNEFAAKDLRLHQEKNTPRPR